MGIHTALFVNHQNTNLIGDFQPKATAYMQMVRDGMLAMGLVRDTTMPFRAGIVETEDNYVIAQPSAATQGDVYIGDIFYKFEKVGFSTHYFRCRYRYSYYHSTTSSAAHFGIYIEWTHSPTSYDSAGNFVQPVQTWWARGNNYLGSTSEDLASRGYYFIGTAGEGFAFYLADVIGDNLQKAGGMGFAFTRTSDTAFTTDDYGVTGFYIGFNTAGAPLQRHTVKMRFPAGGHVTHPNGPAAMLPGSSGLISPDYYYGQLLTAQPEIRTSRNLIGVFTGDIGDKVVFAVPGLGNFRALHHLTGFDFAVQGNAVCAIREPV